MKMTNGRKSSSLVKSHEVICHFIRGYLDPLPPYIKAKVLFIPLVYGILSIIAILIKKKNDSGLMKLHVEDVIGTMISFVTSGYETKIVNYTFRLMSKCIFSGIMIVTSIIVGITQLSKLEETKIDFDLSYCQSICPEDKSTDETDAGNKV